MFSGELGQKAKLQNISDVSYYVYIDQCYIYDEFEQPITTKWRIVYNFVILTPLFVYFCLFLSIFGPDMAQYRTQTNLDDTLAICKYITNHIGII